MSYNSSMNIFDNFDAILAEFNKRDEPLFLRDIREFAEIHRHVVIKTFSVLLKNPDLNIQLKYLVLKSIGELKFNEFIPFLKEALHHEKKIQIINEAVNSLTVIGSFSAYKVVVDYLLKHRDAEFTERIERHLRDLFVKNPLAYHFDVFYRNRGSTSNIEKSADFLIQHLPEEFVSDILPALNSRFYNIRLGLLRLLGAKPNPVFYANIYNYFKGHYVDVDNELFLALCEALVNCASLSKARSKIFEGLKAYVADMTGIKKKVFCIALMKMSNKELIHYISAVYPQLNFDRKMLVFDNLDPAEYSHYMGFIRDLLTVENNETLLNRVVGILLQAKEIEFLFATVNDGNGLRRSKILGMIMDHDPKDIEDYMRHFVNPDQDNRVLYMAVQYLLRYAADANFELIKKTFFSGASAEIKTLIIRSVNRWDAFNQKVFMEAVFKDLKVVSGFRKDFLLSLLGVMNEKVFETQLEEKILSRVLVMMEEAPEEELVNFIYFFDKYEINNSKDRELIIDELRLWQNTLLKSGSDQNLVRMLHVLVKNIENKPKTKKV